MDLLARNAEDVKDVEVDGLPEIVRIKTLIAEKEREHQAAVSRATEYEKNIKGLSLKATRCEEEIRVIEERQPILAAAALLDGDAARKEFSAQVALLNQHQQWLRTYELAKPHLQLRVRTAFSPAHALGAAIVQYGEQLAGLRRAEKIRIARGRMEGTEQRR